MFEPTEIPASAKGILDFIGKLEAPRGYTDYYRGIKTEPPKPLTQMTLNEVLSWMHEVNPPGAGTNAVGKYQIVDVPGAPTFSTVMKELGFTGDELFDESTQDQMAFHLMRKRGWDKFVAGKMSATQFGNRLAREWASLPVLSGPNKGKSYYAGDGVNASLTATDAFLGALGSDAKVMTKTAAHHAPEPNPPSAGPEEVAPAAAPFPQPGPSAGSHIPTVGTASAEPSGGFAPGFVKLANASPLAGNADIPLAGGGGRTAPRFRSSDVDAAVEEKIAKEREQAPGILEGAGLAIESEWVGAAALRHIGREDFVPDPDFVMTDELAKELTEGLPEDYIEMFADATSEAHARAIRVEAEGFLERERKLAQMGATGVALRVGAAVLDPVAIGAAIITDGVAAPALVGAKATRISRAVAAGLSAGASNAAIEAYLASQDPTRDGIDVLYAGMTGLALGGLLGYGIRTPSSERIANIARTYLEEEADRVIAEGSAGAAAVPREALKTPMEQYLERTKDAPNSFGGKLRFDMVGSLMESKNSVVRWLAPRMAEDGTGVGGVSATENLHRRLNAAVSVFGRTAKSEFNQWAKKAGIPVIKRAFYFEDFMEQVTKAVRRKPGEWTDDVHVNKVADQMRQQFAETLRWGKEKGIFDPVIPEDASYVSRFWRLKAFDDMVERVRHGDIVRLFSESLADSFHNSDAIEPTEVANAFIRSIRNRRFDDFNGLLAFDSDNRSLLEEMLIEEGIDAERVGAFLDQFKPNPEAGKLGHARRRLKLDETTKIKAFDKKTGKEIEIGIEDFLENDAFNIFTRYHRSVYGRGEWEDVMRSLDIEDGAGGTRTPTWETAIRHIREAGEASGQTTSEINSDIHKLGILRSAILGLPLDKNRGRISETLQLLRDWQFTRVMGQAGFAQVAEVGNVVGQTGWRAITAFVPAVKSLFLRARDGRLPDELLDELETVMGIGSDRIRRDYSNRLDDFGVIETPGVSKLAKILQLGKAAVADASGMAPINSILQRAAGRAIVNKFAQMADGARSISMKRLQSLGLDDEMAERIFEMIRTNTDYVDGFLGRKVKQLHLDRWDDIEAREAFSSAVFRSGRRLVQENDVGQMSAWMTQDWAKTLLQFRSFMLGAYTKQLLFGLRMHDIETFNAFMGSMFFGGLSYVAQTYIKSIGMEEERRKEFLSKRLSTDAIATSAFQRAGFSTFLPAAIDVGARMVGEDPLFAYGRSTGLSTSNITSNPTFDMIDRLVLRGGIGITSDIAQGRNPINRENARNVLGSLMLQNTIGVYNGINIVTDALPERAK